MTTAIGGSWYIAAKPTSYGIWGFLLALVGGTLLAGGFDLAGQLVYAMVTGGTPETVLRGIAAAAVDIQAIDDPQQVQLIGLGVHFAIIAVMTLVYLIAAARIALINSTPELSTLWFGMIAAAVMMWVVIPLRWPAAPLTIDPLVISGQILRHIFLVAMPIATMAKLGARSA